MNYKLWKRSRRVPDKIKFKSGDPIIVIAGKDKGTGGRIKSIDPKRGTLIVEGVNEVTNYTKGGGQNNPGKMVEIAAPIHVSNVMYYSDKAGGPIRIGAKLIDGKKVRYCHKHNLVLDGK